jgi:hypothetical protein
MRPDRPIPSVDAASFEPAKVRTGAIRAALGLACLGLLAFAVYVALGLQAPAGSVIPQGRSGVIVLDLSRSIGTVPGLLVRRALTRLDSPDERVGLVVFSDTAYEILPPGSPGNELDPVIRFFTPIRGRTDRGRAILPTSPWDDTFRAGTQISTGLRAGWTALRRDHIRNGTLVLVSDLADEADDVQNLVPLVIQMQKQGVQIRILGLAPTPTDKNLFARLVGNDAFVAEVPADGVNGVVDAVGSALDRPLPWALIGCAVALLLALGANELLCGRLELPARGSA